MASIEFPVTKSSCLSAIDRELEMVSLEGKIYETNVSFYRRLSWITRLFGVVFFSLGILLPLLQSAIQNIAPNFPSVEIAYAFLVLAGISILVDQVFVHTDGWLTFSMARNSADAIRDDLEVFRIRFAATITNDISAQEALEGLLGKIEEARQGANTIRETTQSNLSQKLIDGRHALQQRIVDATPEAKQHSREESARRSALQETGARKRHAVGLLEIDISNPEGFTDIKVTVNDQPSDWEPGRRSQVFPDVPLGYVRVEVSAKADGHAYISERAVRVVENEVTKKTITFPRPEALEI